MEDYVIELEGITKDFPGIRANDNVSLTLRRGEIHALLGENGAGKSTLMSVLFGLYQPDGGTIKKNGNPVKINNPGDANELGIGMVHQHFKLVHNFTVLENICLGVETTKRGLLSMDDARKKIVRQSEAYGLAVDPDKLISDITVGMQQRVEILKMLYRENEILIFDEPTAVLTPQEIMELMHIMKNLTAEGKSILFITHKLAEIKQVADRCTVLRKGKYIGTVNVAETSMEQMSEMMVGRKVEFTLDKNAAKPSRESALSVRGLTAGTKRGHKPKVKDVSFDVRRGEIVCVAGIDGNGQTELVYALTGLLPLEHGAVTMNGKDISRANVRARNALGLSHIPEDRHKHGLVLDYTLEDNMALKSYWRHPFQRRGFLSRTVFRGHADRLCRDFDVRSGQGGRTIARSLSGGNQQKAIIAREMGEEPSVLIAVQPTRGLDVGAIEYIHHRILDARDAGRAVLLVSLELDEVLNLSDRILVMYEGEIVADLQAKDATAQELGLYMAGSKRMNNEKLTMKN
ncbi:MAG: ABC transporter ATP-binding protein [Oscillospiraceae bacterium]|jgi:simple sugar transport system ATP-binding protein|nr:ABC transporter ATP-binding protein [Oscillospiraceae bacterium]